MYRDGELHQGAVVLVSRLRQFGRNAGKSAEDVFSVFSGFAYTLLIALRRLVLEGTEWARAQVNTIR